MNIEKKILITEYDKKIFNYNKKETKPVNITN